MRKLILALALSGIVLGDAGYLGSVVQGPVPLDGDSTAVRLLCQDVLIEVGSESYRLTGAFLFCAEGDAESVYMYFPVDVVTPFVSALYSALKPDAVISRVSVSVNGEEREVFPLFVESWSPDPAAGVTWKRASRLMRPLYTEEPQPGDPVYWRRIPTAAELTASSSRMNSISPAFTGQAMHAAWKADFSGGDTVLVEYSVTGDMSTDYESTESILCYPLQTGSTWAGPIDSGRVTVVPMAPLSLGDIAFAVGVMMPPPARSDRFEYAPLEEIARHPAFGGTALSEMEAPVFDGALTWIFGDFEPALAPTGWRALHPGLGDMYALVADSMARWRSGEIGRRPAGWTGSYVYVYVAEEPPEGLSVMSVDGLPLLAAPEAGAEVTAELPVTTWLSVLERRGDWLRVRASVSEYLDGRCAGEHTGWVNLARTGDHGLVLPSAIPLL